MTSHNPYAIVSLKIDGGNPPEGLEIPMRLIDAFRQHAETILRESHISGNELDSRSRRFILFSSLSSNIVLSLMAGSYLTGFFLAIGGNANYINQIVLLLSVCSLAQLLSPFWFERLRRRKKILICLRMISYILSLLVAPALAFLGLPKDTLLALTGAVLCLAQLITAWINPGMQAWHVGSLHIDKRLGFFSLSNIINCVVSLTSLFGASLLVDAMVRRVGDAYAMPLLRIIAFSLAILDILCLRKVHEYEYAAAEPLSPRGMIHSLRRHPAYLKVIAAACIWSFASNLPSQYYVTYLLEDLKLSYTFLNSVNLYSIVATLLFTRAWKKIIGRYSLGGGLFSSITLYSFYALGLFFTTVSNTWMYPVSMIYVYHFTIGINICFAMVPYFNLPEENHTLYLALYNTCNALASLPGMLLGRVLYNLMTRHPVRIMGEVVAPARILVLTLFVVLLLTGFIIRILLKEEKGQARQT